MPLSQRLGHQDVALTVDPREASGPSVGHGPVRRRTRAPAARRAPGRTAAPASRCARGCAARCPTASASRSSTLLAHRSCLARSGHRCRGARPRAPRASRPRLSTFGSGAMLRGLRRPELQRHELGRDVAPVSAAASTPRSRQRDTGQHGRRIGKSRAASRKNAPVLREDGRLAVAGAHDHAETAPLAVRHLRSPRRGCSSATASRTASARAFSCPLRSSSRRRPALDSQAQYSSKSPRWQAHVRPVPLDRLARRADAPAPAPRPSVGQELRERGVQQVMRLFLACSCGPG